MKDTKEVVLTFKEKYDFSNVTIAANIKKRFEDVGEPTILPVQKGLPRILFNNNPSFMINVNNECVSFIINHEFFSNIINIIFDIVDVFEEEKIYFKKIGCVSNIFLSPNLIDKIKKEYVKIEMPGDFNISWYKELSLKNYNLNCWQRFITDKDRFKDLLIQFDINTKLEDEIDFDIKFIKEFVNTSNEYIEKNINL